MSIAEREAVHEDRAKDRAQDSTVLSGGDQSATPINQAQQQVLLDIEALAGDQQQSLFPTAHSTLR